MSEPVTTTAAPAGPVVFDEEITEILIRAYADRGTDAYADLDKLTTRLFNWPLRAEFGASDLPTRALIEPFLERVSQEGADAIRRCVAAFYQDLPANGALRVWVAHHLPDAKTLVSEAEFDAAKKKLTENRVETVTAAIDASREAHLAPQISAEGRQALREIADRLNQLKAFKDIHDAFHGVQTGAYLALTGIAAKTAFAPEDQELIETQVSALEVAQVRIEGVFQDIPDEAADWAPRLVAVIVKLKAEPRTPPSLQVGLYLMSELLRQGLLKFDAEILRTAEAIPFQTLVDMLKNGAGLAGLDPALAATLNKASADLAALDASLTRTRTLHRLWQQVDSTLWPLEQELQGRPNARDIVDAFWDTRVRPDLNAIREAAPDLWDAVLDSEALKTEGAIDQSAGAEPTSYVLPLRAFVRVARLQFSRIDMALRSQCTRIAELSRPIESLLGDPHG